MKKIVYIGLGLMLHCVIAHAQSYQWAKNIGSTGTDKGNSIAVDDSGNTYITGSFSGAGTANRTSVGYKIVIFEKKLRLVCLT